MEGVEIFENEKFVHYQETVIIWGYICWSKLTKLPSLNISVLLQVNHISIKVF